MSAMNSSVCFRCLRRPGRTIESPSNVSLSHRAAFSFTPITAANPVKKKSGPPAAPKKGSRLKLRKNVRTVSARPPSAGERKTFRKKVVLENPNALEVDDLRDMTAANVRPEMLQEQRGQVMRISTATVEALRDLEAFKPTQGWRSFRRPATLVRQETVEMAEMLHEATDGKKVNRRVVFGDGDSGKSVLALQAMAIALVKGCAVVHIPEAHELTMSLTAYRPIDAADGQTMYIQPQYTAQLLGRVTRANRVLFDSLRLSKTPKLPVPVQENISLTRFAELGAGDEELAWPVWQTLMADLLMPSQSGKGLQRPPIVFCLDGAHHIMANSAYLDPDAKPVHAHDLALIRDFTKMLSGETAMPNGGLILTSTSASNKLSTPTFSHLLAVKEAEIPVTELMSLRDRLRTMATDARKEGLDPADIDFGDLGEGMASQLPSYLAPAYQGLIGGVRKLQQIPTSTYNLSDFIAMLDNFSVSPPSWDPYKPLDDRVAKVLDTVTARKLRGLSKSEARGIMNYYARSGMVRDSITARSVNEQWTLAGNGLVGLIERAAIRGY
ncbi:hypothetical protein K470DRAFT_261000 [Piedraia hortae CBS 480.64]|uniref:Small ribosomal subunit protein mS29 n=1 Tax=Piedraia hortae CBS 480.64 TaxID=1314780 RepID=A0A6A7BPM2_9PEZI|nr:hypothetical protein K470DRAFT_261000 [Piedraia hortae CBS 480.64]